MSAASPSRRGDAVPLERKLAALEEAAGLAAGRVPEEALAGARQVVERAGQRRRLSAEHTVVGFFGATGSGKSSLFNAVTGHPLARAAATRPTTSEPLAAVWGAEGSGPLLDWLGVDRRHLLDGPAAGAELTTRWGGRRPSGGLILLDLPDFDSIAAGHREVVQRLVGQVDVLVWVVDPQKYADAALHREFLEPLAAHRAVTLVVLNQVDRLAPRDVDRVVASLRDILARDGLDRVPVHPVSATTGAGVDAVREAIAEVAAQRSAATERLLSDVRTAARALGDRDAAGVPAGVGTPAEDRLVDALAEASGAGTVVRAVERSYRLEATRRTGWPVLRWLARTRQDPLRRLGLRRGAGGANRTGTGEWSGPAPDDPRLHRTSLPERSPAQRAQADGAIRAFADAASAGAPDAWRSAARRAARSHAEALPDALDQAITATDLRAGVGSWWWHVVNVLQWLALLAAVAGAAWLGGLALAAYLQFRLPPAPDVEGFPLPTLLLLGGLLTGLLLSLLSAPLVRLAGRSRARRARRRLRASIARVTEERVVAPVREEIARYGRFREALAAASGKH
ncbi:ABC transporter [Citricoccus sp. SGAir0253]|uniref:GTPase family protein n=1 Tax=Citricoccus sp. SGAir0253 TaxID=2567881 RepID=UPI0010CD47E5|nr:GTPase [Citricoccus sp. SGAir0253]QCU78377.1 ABC transporter [Citricoccus sp. SGAir0253]